MRQIGAALLILATCAAQAKRLNFVFMFPDTLRAESFSAYGQVGQLKTTPNLDEFAKTAVRFEQCHVQHTQCSPSRATMFTGRYMHVLGHRTQTHLIQPYEHNYFQTMKRNGYHIEYLGKNDAFSEDSMNSSISHWSNDIGTASGKNAFNYGEAGYYSMLSTGSDVSKNDTDANGDYRAVVKAVDWMKNSPPEPFVLFLPGRGAHPPYGSPREFNDMWDIETVKQNVQLRPPYDSSKPAYHSKDRGIPHYRNLTSLGEDTFYKIQATYLGMISYTDWMFGQLLKGLKESGLEDSTAVFFSSDHGDFAGDFHMIEKWPGGADDILTRVPLFARVPGSHPKARGMVARAPVALIDVPHTMALLAGINVTGDGTGDYGINFGTSLEPQLMRGEEGDTARFVYSEGGFSTWNEIFPMGSDHVPDDPKGMYYPRAMEEMSDDGSGSPKWVMVRNQTHKLVYRPKGDSELYDLIKDPRELKNVWANDQYLPLRSELLMGLMEWLVQTSDATPTTTDPRGSPHYPHPASACAQTYAPHQRPQTVASADLLEANGVKGFYDKVERVASVGGPAQKCLQDSCGIAYDACKLASACRTGVIDCMAKCTTVACDEACTTSAQGSLPKAELPLLFALSYCGGEYGCFS